MVFESILVKIACRSLGLPESIPDVTLSNKLRSHQTDLLRLFQKTKNPTNAQLSGLVDPVHHNEVRVWFREQKKAEKDRLSVKKYTEAAWRFFFYTSLCVLGWYIVSDKPWMWSAELCYENYPDMPMDWLHKQFYLIETAVYLHLLISQFFDIKRDDFWEMFIHHIATIALLVFSYLTNIVRSGALIMVVHDSSDVFLEFAKLAKYNKWGRTCDVAFVFFAVSFFVFRLIVYPFYLIRGFAVVTLDILNGSFGYWFTNAFLGVLLCLHIFWFYLIMRMVFRLLVKGEVEKDIRSGSDSDKTD